MPLVGLVLEQRRCCAAAALPEVGFIVVLAQNAELKVNLAALAPPPVSVSIPPLTLTFDIAQYAAPCTKAAPAKRGFRCSTGMPAGSVWTAVPRGEELPVHASSPGSLVVAQ